MVALFLDRDGVINRERADYVKCWEEFEFLPGALPALAALARLEIPLFIITNQSAIGRRIVRAEEVARIHQRMTEAIRAAGGRVDDIFICPHHPAAGCDCRKPRPGLLQRAAARYGLSLPACYFVGDAISDMRAAHAAGCRSILLRSGRQGASLEALLQNEPGVPLLPDLTSVVPLLTEQIAAWQN